MPRAAHRTRSGGTCPWTRPGTFALSSADCFADMTGRAAGLGFTDVITHWPRPSGWYAGDESVLETVAARMMSGRALDR